MPCIAISPVRAQPLGGQGQVGNLWTLRIVEFRYSANQLLNTVKHAAAT
ncbi:hypothetical protein ACVOMS_03775 [Bradyrhizobium guangxiense]